MSKRKNILSLYYKLKQEQKKLNEEVKALNDHIKELLKQEETNTVTKGKYTVVKSTYTRKYPKNKMIESFIRSNTDNPDEYYYDKEITTLNIMKKSDNLDETEIEF